MNGIKAAKVTEHLMYGVANEHFNELRRQAAQSQLLRAERPRRRRRINLQRVARVLRPGKAAATEPVVGC